MIGPEYNVDAAVGIDPSVVYLMVAVGDSVESSSEKLLAKTPLSLENQTSLAKPAVFGRPGVGCLIEYQAGSLSGYLPSE